MNTLESIRQMPDCDLVASLDGLARRDRETTSAILAHLVVVHERSIHLDAGYASIIEYSTDRLGTSRDVAYKRAAAVKVAALYPEVLAWLAVGETTVSALAVLAPHRDDAELVAAGGLPPPRLLWGEARCVSAPAPEAHCRPPSRPRLEPGPISGPPGCRRAVEDRGDRAR